ncbi:MAG: hypothetical protein DRP47_04235 [Candidatus Zixiibacteriota bacterium]|nr:MAG: hypothetical protein DRP47_04235 [candidate division Zixibacteria bacterium]
MYVVATIIVVAGFVAWQSDLTADPPMYFSGIGQSLSTDPAQYTFHARNKVLYGEFDPFDYPRWTVYQHSLTSLIAWGWFSIFGVSQNTASMVGILLSLGALVFLILGVARHHHPWVTAAIALCYVVNLTLLTHGRLSYLENGMLFLVAAAFWVYSYWGTRTLGVAVAGGLVAASMLTGKLFGALFLPALILAIFFSGDPRRWKLILSTVIGFAVVTPLLLLALYGADFSAVNAYFGEQAYGLRGFPNGLKSPWAFVEQLVSYGFGNHFFYLTPDLLLFLVVGMILPVQFRLGKSRLSPVTLLAIFWIALAVVGLSPLNYSPIRYTLLVIPAIIVLCFTMFDCTREARARNSDDLNRWQLALIAGAFWLFLVHLAGNTLFFDTFPRPIRLITWATLLPAIGLAWTAKRLMKQKLRSQTSKRAWTIAVVVVLAASVTINGFRIHRFHILESNYNIAEANADLASILGPEAVVSGPYGPALTIDNDLRSFIHLFQVAKVDERLFIDNPITHLAMDISNYTEAVRQYPLLKDLPRVNTYWIRDTEVGLFRISHLFGNPDASSYQLSKYEQAVECLQTQRYDSALALAAEVYQAHPESKSAGLLYGSMLLETGKTQIGYHTLVSLAEKFPTDFYIQLQCGRFLQMLAYKSGDQSLSNTAQGYYARAVKVNRYKAAYARNLWDRTAQQMTKGSTPRGGSGN